MKPKRRESAPSRTICQNKRILADYKIEERIEAGMVLAGWEAKALRLGRGSLAGSRVSIRKGEMFLFGASITPTKESSSMTPLSESTRERKLLLSRREIDRLTGKVERSGMTLLVLDLHWTRGKAKAEVVLCKGMDKEDKRRREAERSADDQARNAMKAERRRAGE